MYDLPERLTKRRKPIKIYVVGAKRARRTARGGREVDRETVSTMDEAVSTTDDLGSVGPDVAPGAEPLVDSSLAAAAAAAGGGVEVVSAHNREGTRDPLKYLFSVENSMVALKKKANSVPQNFPRGVLFGILKKKNAKAAEKYCS